MQTRRNPVHQSGERNAFCPFYSHCLDKAVERGWEDWDCSFCSHRFNQEARPEIRLTVNDNIAYYETLYDS